MVDFLKPYKCSEVPNQAVFIVEVFTDENEPSEQEVKIRLEDESFTIVKCNTLTPIKNILG